MRSVTFGQYICGNSFMHKATPNTKLIVTFIYIFILFFLNNILPYVFTFFVVMFLYSSSYEVVGDYAIWLAVGFTIHGIGDMINRYLGSHGKGKEIRNASIANGLFKVFGYTVFVYFFNTPGALATTILCDFIYAFVIAYYYKKMVKERCL